MEGFEDGIKVGMIEGSEEGDIPHVSFRLLWFIEWEKTTCFYVDEWYIKIDDILIIENIV